MGRIPLLPRVIPLSDSSSMYKVFFEPYRISNDCGPKYVCVYDNPRHRYSDENALTEFFLYRFHKDFRVSIRRHIDKFYRNGETFWYDREIEVLGLDDAIDELEREVLSLIRGENTSYSWNKVICPVPLTYQEEMEYTFNLDVLKDSDKYFSKFNSMLPDSTGPYAWIFSNRRSFRKEYAYLYGNDSTSKITWIVHKLNQVSGETSYVSWASRSFDGLEDVDKARFYFLLLTRFVVDSYRPLDVLGGKVRRGKEYTG